MEGGEITITGLLMKIQRPQSTQILLCVLRNEFVELIHRICRDARHVRTFRLSRSCYLEDFLSKPTQLETMFCKTNQTNVLKYVSRVYCVPEFFPAIGGAKENVMC
jgi:hypothetical protein